MPPLEDKAAADPPTALRTLAVIPARLASTRLERKMLLADTGTYLFEHTVRAVEAAAPAITRTVLATDSEEILNAAREVSVDALMTSPDCPSGTDRVYEAWRLLEESDGPWGVVVNVQGDEPEIARADLAALVACFEDPAVHAATLCAPIESEAEAADPAVVKVVRDARGDAMYFSRSPIPARSHARNGASGLERLERHLGVYAFRPAALKEFRELPPSRLEEAENLEQLRWLESGQKMRVARAGRASR
ncbi:MAG: 3-deoxy-manno-octulosonate cytidylyltransferase, partial [Planctomycetota bacterium]